MVRAIFREGHPRKIPVILPDYRYVKMYLLVCEKKFFFFSIFSSGGYLAQWRVMV